MTYRGASRATSFSAGIKPIGFVESENMMTLLSLCAAGLGGLFCPTNMLDETTDLTKNLVRIKLSEEAGYQISIGTPKGSSPASAEMFEDIPRLPLRRIRRRGGIARKSAAGRGPGDAARASAAQITQDRALYAHSGTRLSPRLARVIMYQS